MLGGRIVLEDSALFPSVFHDEGAIAVALPVLLVSRVRVLSVQ